MPTTPRLSTRATAALMLLPLLVSPAGALTPLAVAPDDEAPRIDHPVVWPKPAPTDSFSRDRALLRTDLAMTQGHTPHFHAPSASSCGRPVRTHEEPGALPARSMPALSAPALRGGRAGKADAPAAESVVALSAPPPAGAAPTAGDAHAAPAAPAARPARETRAPQSPVTAGMVDDNADFAAYLAYLGRTQVAHRERDVRQRLLLQVRDTHGRAVPDAEVLVRASRGGAQWARTDTAGRAWIAPRAFDPQTSPLYEVTVRQGEAQSSAVFRPGQQSAVDVTLDARAPARRARLDLVFLIDATGSMSDEIAKLKATLRTIADDVARLPSRPDTCFGLVAYRDKGDAYVLRSHDFTSDLDAFQQVLDQLQAAGGGDEPEAMNEALFEAVHALGWRGGGATRLMVLLADAPPHLDYEGPQYDDTMMAALGKGIKIFSVGASGLNPQGEFIQRQIAQYTGGRFVFLTYRQARDPASGPGRETVHDVGNYSVETLDRLIVRLVSDELARLPGAGPSPKIARNAL